MNTESLTCLLVSMGTVTALTGYFFVVGLTAKPKPEPDIYTDDDNDE